MLIVLEGPDNVGKTTLSKNLSLSLGSIGYQSEHFSFPGNKDGTLGKFIHEFHHQHNEYGIQKLSPVSLQLLHVAAHFDTISDCISPALKEGKVVILDRFWWSTYVYSKVSGIDDSIIEKILEIEEIAWKDVKPDHVFLISNDNPIGEQKTKEWNSLRKEYLKLANKQRESLPISILKNDDTIEAITRRIISILNLDILIQENSF